METPTRASDRRSAASEDVAASFSGRARAAQPALVDGVPGLEWAPGGRPRVVFAFTFSGGRIVAIDLLSDPERLSALDVALLDG